MQDRLCSESEAAKFLHVSQVFLKKRRARGLPPRFVRLSTKAIRYRLEDLRAFVAARMVEPKGETEQRVTA